MISFSSAVAPFKMPLCYHSSLIGSDQPVILMEDIKGASINDVVDGFREKQVIHSFLSHRSLLFLIRRVESSIVLFSLYSMSFNRWFIVRRTLEGNPSHFKWIRPIKNLFQLYSIVDEIVKIHAYSFENERWRSIRTHKVNINESVIPYLTDSI